MADFLFELGCEELPAAHVDVALAHLRAAVPQALAAARLQVAEGAVTVLGTPRRLAVLATGVPERQADLSEQVVGPPASAAYKNGAPTKAAEGFARKNGVGVGDLVTVEVEGKKGSYVACTRAEVGRPAFEVLASVFEGLLASLPWPKSMRWSWLEQSFSRPVHWIVALLGGEVVPVSFAGVRAGRQTRGHRFLAPAKIALDGTAEGYRAALRAAFVIVDPDARAQTIAAELARVEADIGSHVRPDPELLAEVVNLVEYPVAICGSFDEAFLEVPDEVIVSAMRAHQRYFAVEDAKGALQHRFVTIAGTITRDAAVVRHGNERVLAARLSDARFFFREDRKRSLDELAGALDKVVFQTKLGTIGAKVSRVGALARALAARGELSVDAAVVTRAAALAKADLVTHMVGEFPDLQGVMGAHYARLAGEPAGVADAIVEHYQPKGAGDSMPASGEGACLGVADRLDTIVGCFCAGLAPTGSADPYALRRAALAVLAILLEREWRVPLEWLVDRAGEGLAGSVTLSSDVRDQILAFFRVRLRGVLVDRGLPPDCVNAALATDSLDVPDAAARADAVARLRLRPDFEPLATAFKRVANILKGETAAAAPQPARFAEAAERALWDRFVDIRSRVDERLGHGEYHAALAVLAELAAPVDAFFVGVMVMADDPAVRENRLALLAAINVTFTRIADFRQLAV